MTESLFRSVKKERIKTRIYPTRETLLADIAECVENFYSHTRRHNCLGAVGPEQIRERT